MPTVELAEPGRDPEPAGWREFRRAEYLTASWDYEVLTAAAAGSWSPPLLAVVRDRDRIVGSVGAVYRGLRSSGTPRRGPRVVDVRLPSEGHGPTWHFTAGVDQADRAVLLRDYERALKRRLGRGLTGAVYRQVSGAEIPAVGRRGAVLRPISPAAELPLPYDSLDGWYGSLHAKRGKALRRRARSLDQELTITLGAGRTDLDPVQLADLFGRQADRLGSRIDRRPTLRGGFLATLAACPDVTTLTYADPAAGDRLLAFGMMLHHPVRPLLGFWAALDPAEGGRKHLYFDCYPRYVAAAIALGAQRLSAGRGALESKLELGFEPVPLRMAVVPRWAMG